MVQDNSHTGYFEEQFAKLNAAQKQAVTQTEGPVMVIAGPGTGKTQILAARIANILLATDANPENILCLTFTEAGSHAMRDRLTRFIGPAAYRVQIHTFHSFCHKVISENKDVYSYILYEPVSDIEKHEIAREILDELPITHPLKKIKGKKYSSVFDLLRLFDLMKKEEIDLSLIRKKCELKLNDALSDPTFYYQRNGANFKKGDLKTREIDDLRKRLDHLTSAAELLSVYKQKLDAKERYDFNDMISWVIELFKNYPEKLLRYQEQYLYILVDEFQDTNAVQYHIIQQLSSYWEENPNLFVVGDDDQTIYRFQGAEITNIRDFKQRYDQHLQTIILKENYRSGQEILNTAGKVIENNTQRLVDTSELSGKSLIAANPNILPKSTIPRIFGYSNDFSEVVEIAHSVEQLLKEGIESSEVAIIYRKHKQADDLITHFRQIGLPYHLVKQENILEFPLIRQFLDLLNYIQLETEQPFSAQDLLFRVLHFEPFGLSALPLARFQHSSHANRTPLRVLLADSKYPEGISDEEVKRVNQVIQKIEDWISQTHYNTPLMLAEKILNESGLLAHILKQSESEKNLESFMTLFDFFKEESGRRNDVSLKNLLQAIALMSEYEMPIPMQYSYGHEHGVRLMTAHGAKGLEFDHVFVIGCTQADWERNQHQGRFNLEVLFPNLKDEFAIEESRRLFYVAITRARTHLTISFSWQNSKGKEQAPTRFIAETGLEIKNVSGSDARTTQFIRSLFRKHEISEIPQEKLFGLLPSNYAISVTHLNTYLRCPLSFYYNYVLRVPAAKNPNMSYGSAIHGLMEDVFTQFYMKGLRPSTPQIIEIFEKQMFLQRSGFTPSGFKDFLESGKEDLPGYFMNRESGWIKHMHFAPEKKISVLFDEIPITGVLDRVDIDNKQVMVTDYKTGNPTNSKSKLNKPNPEKQQSGGDYWRQTMFYSILIREDPTLDWSMTCGEIDFVEPDENGVYQKHFFPVTQEGIQDVESQIKLVYAKIMNREFSQGCDDPSCYWCNFVRQYGL